MFCGPDEPPRGERPPTSARHPAHGHARPHPATGPAAHAKDTMSDAVSRFLDSWSRLRPDLDLTSMAAMGRVLRLAALMNNATEDGLADAEVTRPEFEVLAALRRSPHGLRPRQLTRETISSGAATTKRLTRLEAAGLITRTPSNATAARSRSASPNADRPWPTPSSPDSSTARPTSCDP